MEGRSGAEKSRVSLSSAPGLHILRFLVPGEIGLVATCLGLAFNLGDCQELAFIHSPLFLFSFGLISNPLFWDRGESTVDDGLSRDPVLITLLDHASRFSTPARNGLLSSGRRSRALKYSVRRIASFPCCPTPSLGSFTPRRFHQLLIQRFPHLHVHR